MARKHLLLLTCALGAISAAGAASAQSDSTVIEEIVVTANKRAENLQDVAATVTAVFDRRLGFIPRCN